MSMEIANSQKSGNPSGRRRHAEDILQKEQKPIQRSYSFNPSYHTNDHLNEEYGQNYPSGYEQLEDIEQQQHIQQPVDNNENNILLIRSHQSYTTYRQMCKDIEFIQMLGDPRYVIALHEKGYFFNKDFKEYIIGLKCFLRNMMLRRLIKYPEGLFVLEQMVEKGFIQAFQSVQFKQRFMQRFMLNSLKRSLMIQSCKKIMKKPQQQQNPAHNKQTEQKDQQ